MNFDIEKYIFKEKDHIEKLRDELVKVRVENNYKDERISELERKVEELSLALNQQHSPTHRGLYLKFDVKTKDKLRTRNKKLGVSAEVYNQNYLHEFIHHEKDLEVQDLIRNALLKNELFQHLEICQIYEIVESMYVIRVKANENVIEEGTEANKLFVVQKGKFNVFKGENKIFEISEHTSFGEFSLLYNGLRTETVTACTDAILWVIGRETFKGIMHKTCCRRHIEFKRFLKNVSVLNNLPDSIISKLCDHMEVHVYSKKQIIIRQGQVGNHFFIIQSGSVYVTKMFNGSTSERRLRKLNIGDYFGEISLLKGVLRTASVYAADDHTTVLSLNRITFLEFLTDINEIKNKSYEDNEQLNDLKIKDIEHPIISKDLSDIQKLKILGIGSFAKVYLVSVKGHDNQSFALKCMRKDIIVKTKQETHILSERNILSEIYCSFICRFYQSYRDNKFVYLLIEVCLGGELWTILRNKSFFDDNTCKFCLGCVIGAIEYLHNKSIVYRDLKPENLLISEKNGYLKLCDFGFSKMLPIGEKTFTFCGTPAYIAPEIILNKSHDFSADLWSLGILTYELLTGLPPFVASDNLKIYAMTLKGIESLNLTRKKKISYYASSFINKLCKLKPAERLGNGKYGFNDIKSHKYFQGFDWDKINNFMIVSPFQSNINNIFDSSNFDNFVENNTDVVEETSGWDIDF